jgi:hypothetical protein
LVVVFVQLREIPIFEVWWSDAALLLIYLRCLAIFSKTYNVKPAVY